MQKNLLVNG